MAEKFDSELEKMIASIKDACDKEDLEVYRQQQAFYRRNELYYHGLQFIYQNYLSNGWELAPSLLTSLFGMGATNEQEGNEEYYDYIVNIIKPHGDNFIAALSSDIPSTLFPPADMRSANDISTARAYNKLSELIDNQNPIKYLFIKLLFIKYTQGVVGIYTYPDTNDKYGTYKIPKFVKGEDGELQNVGEQDVPRTRVLMTVDGPLNIKFPYYVKEQEDFGYLQWITDQHYAQMQELYDDDDIVPSGSSEGGRFYRTPTSYTVGYEGTREKNLVTVTRSWIRPWMYRVIKETDKSTWSYLHKNFPLGMYTVHVNKKLEELKNQSLDSRWTLSRSGTSSHVLTDPECQSLMHFQDIKNTLVNKTVDTIEHMSPLVLADPEVLDFDKYGKIEANPDYIYQAKRAPGMRSLSDGITEVGKSQLSAQVANFNAQLDSEAQFVFGDFPAVFGGSMGDRVPGVVYEQSKGQALQRWNIPWHEVTDLWKRAKMKAVRLMAANMADVEKFTKKVDGRFLTTYIQRHELKGEVGDTEPEVSEGFPLTAEQKRSWLMQLFEVAAKSEEMMSMLIHPENRETIASLLAFPELHVPGTNQRLKQLIEINQLIASPPTDENASSVPIDFDVDDHKLHAQIVRTFLAGETGIQLKQEEPEMYLNCKLHLKEHLTALQAQMQTVNADKPQGYSPDSSTYSAQE